jgi:DNA-nicking Smr family endonuclease
VARKKQRRTRGEGSPRRGKRRSIRYDAVERDPGDRPSRGPSPAEAPPSLHLRRLRAEEALERLESAVRTHARTGHRELLVVHGRGHRSPGGQPVLKDLVRRWCDDHPALVANWREAPPAWGGEGAVVVTLRR